MRKRKMATRLLIGPDLKLPQLLFGADVGDVGGAWGADSLFSQSQPGVQVGVFLHERVPQHPALLQSAGKNKHIKI